MFSYSILKSETQARASFLLLHFQLTKLRDQETNQRGKSQE